MKEKEKLWTVSLLALHETHPHARPKRKEKKPEEEEAEPTTLTPIYALRDIFLDSDIYTVPPATLKRLSFFFVRAARRRPFRTLVFEISVPLTNK